MFQVAPLPRTLEAARRDLSSPKPEVRADAARDLGQQGQGDDAPARIELLAAALTDASPLVRRRAVLALADVDATGVVPALLGLFADPDLGVRQMAVLAVGELAQRGDEEVEGRLLALARAGDPSIRYQALAALAGLTGAQARAEILAAARDVDPEIRELSVRLAAEHLTGGGALDPELERHFRTAVADEASRVALAAEIEGLTLGLDVGCQHVIGLLIGRLRPSEAADERRAIALAAKGGMNAAVPALRRRAFGWFGISLDPYRWPIRAALARLGDARAMKAIGSGIDRGRWLRRTLAVEAAGAAGLVALLPRLLRLRGRAELVDQDVLEQALTALSAPRV